MKRPKTTSKILSSHLPCPHCSSSDAYSVYDDGHGYCFSCTTYDRKGMTLSESPSSSNTESTTTTTNTNTVTTQSDTDFLYSYEYLPCRGITTETMQFYKISTKVDPNGVPIAHGYPYPNGAVKIRDLTKKDFRSSGPMADATLFGMDKFNAGSAKLIVITEGELDAASVFQMLGKNYPVVSVRSSSSARIDCKREYEYLNSFEKIYICFDNDAPGEKAAKEVASLFNFNKVFHVPITKYKDANDYLQAKEEREFVTSFYNSPKFLPAGIISSLSDVLEVFKQQANNVVANWPWSTVDTMTKGIRHGEIILITAQEGIGKTEVIRAIEYHLLQTTDANLGVIHLEEGQRRYFDGLVGLQTKTAAHIDQYLTPEEKIKYVTQAVKRDNRLHFYTHFSSDDPDSVLDNIRFMVSACECKFIFLDHITMLVSGVADGDERRLLDYLSTRLAMMVEELGFTLFLVSHINDEGKTRGSRNISKVADVHVQLSRDIESENPIVRNTTLLMMKKNRFGSITGPAGMLFFDPDTFTLNERLPTSHELPPVEVQNQNNTQAST